MAQVCKFDASLMSKFDQECKFDGVTNLLTKNKYFNTCENM